MTMIICDIEWVKERALEYAEKVRNEIGRAHV